MGTTTERQVKLLQGNEACSLGAVAAGCRFFAGYPITPSSEIAEQLAALLPTLGGKFIQMEDELASMGAVIGASLTGAKVLTATSGPGFSLKQENLGFATLAEVPCVIVNVMRGGPSTGLPTSPAQSDVMQARWGTHGDHPVIVLTPGTVSEIYTETIRAFNLAERYRVPVILLIDEILGHMREKVEIPLPGEFEIVNRKKPEVSPEEYLPYEDTPDGVPAMANFGEGYRYHVTGLMHDEHGLPTEKPVLVQALQERLKRKIDSHLDDILSTESFLTEDAEIIVFAFGSTARSARRAVREAREQGIRAGLLRPRTLWPFVEKEVETLAQRVKTIVVTEMNMGQMIREVERAVHGKCRVVPCLKADGEPIPPAQILAVVKEA